MRSRLSFFLKLASVSLEPGNLVTRMALYDALKDCRSVLDIGCGKNSRLHLQGFERLVGLEGYPPDAEEARRKRTHDEVIVGDVRDLEKHFQPGQFDAAVALDVIEHLPKEDGLRMLRAMEAISAMRVVILTPSGFLPQGHVEKGDLQVHLSGWDAEEMRQHGYEVIGLLGPKSWRGESHVMQRKPRWFWALLALVAHFFSTRKQPEKSAAIFCVKRIDRPASGKA